jgi:hypothetical protein
MKLIKLNKRKNNNHLYAMVDDSDFNWLNQWNWFAHKRSKKYYAARTIWELQPNGTKKSFTISMHRIIMGITDKSTLVDHKDFSGLNNQRDNLRICSVSQNNAHILPRKNKTSKYLGVYLNKRYNLWVAQVRKNGKANVAGYFKNEKEAAIAYDKKAAELHGEFASLNNIII